VPVQQECLLASCRAGNQLQLAAHLVMMNHGQLPLLTTPFTLVFCYVAAGMAPQVRLQWCHLTGSPARACPLPHTLPHLCALPTHPATHPSTLTYRLQKYRVCEEHAALPSLLLSGNTVRFCQQVRWWW